MASEVERIGEECRRYADHMAERMAEARRRSEARSRELTEQAAADMRQLWQEMAERPADGESRERNSPDGGEDQAKQDVQRALPVGRQPAAESFIRRESEVHRLPAEKQRQQQEAAGPSPVGSGPGRLGLPDEDTASGEQLGELDPKEAIARSIAARRRNSIVAPIDDDGDDEAEYYRRNSWLV